MKPPIPPDESERQAALDRYEVLDTGPEQAFDDLTILASQICHTPVALVSLVDRDRQWFKSKVGLDADETPRELAFCAYAVADNRLLVVPDATADKRFADNPLVTGDPDIRFYAGAPLVTPDGYPLGTLCVIDKVPRDLDPGQLAALEALGRQVVTQLELRRRIAKMKEAETELLRAREEALSANAAKSAFLANMSHELRTPLNAIIGYSELLAEEAADVGIDSLGPDLEKIRVAGKHLLGLINDVLDLSKIEAGQMELYVEPYRVAGLVDEVADAVGELAESQGNRLEVHCAEGLGEARADLTKVRQILYNLLANAAKFTRDGSIVFEARAGGSPAEGERLVFRVTDTGIGMTAEQLTAVFDAFRQADASTTREFGGTGLGLSICRRLAEAMGGSVTAVSELGKGSTFTLDIPREVSAPERPPRQPETGPVPVTPAAASTTASAKVLVIDDDPAAHELAARVLSREGYRVIGAMSGVEGVEMARSERPDVILLDVMMPSMDGWSVLSMLKADADLSAIPVVMQTMLAEEQKAYALGADEYLVKPVSRRRLVAALERLTANGDQQPVMVVDDDPQARELVRRVVERRGGVVIEAADGRQALALLESHQPRLILLDLMMPGMGGVEFLDELRRDPERQGIPVVVLTAKQLTSEDREQLDGAVLAILDKGSSGISRLVEEIRPLIG